MVGGFLWVSAPSTRADVGVFASVQISAEADFNAPLAEHGAWVEVDSYGRCWHPASIAVGWQPYTYGHWVWTDFGWYWVSDEPWGWACYHYGHWFHHPRHGWVWRPGTEWAPAWVSWRVGGGYVGWAPLPPRGGLFVSAPVAPFVFVQAGRFHEPVRPTTVIVNNTTIINQTKVINNIRQETRDFGGSGSRKVMVNEGPGRAEMDKATGNKIRAVSIQEAVSQTPVPKAMERKVVEPRAKDSPVRDLARPQPAVQGKPERVEKPDTAPKPNPPAKEIERPKAVPERKPERVDPPVVAPRPSPPVKETPDRPNLVPERRPDPEPPTKAVPPGKGKDPSRDILDPSPGRPDAPDRTPDAPSRPGKGKDKDRKHGPH